MANSKSINDESELHNLVDVQLEDEIPPSRFRNKSSLARTTREKCRLVLCLLIVLAILTIVTNRETSFIKGVESPTNLDTPQGIGPDDKKSIKSPNAEDVKSPTDSDLDDTASDVKEPPTDLEPDKQEKIESDDKEPSKDPESNDDEKEPLSDVEALIEKWGKWHFWDGNPDSRPTEDYLSAYPNSDCPMDDFPFTAWQGDAVYVNHFLDSGSELIERAKEAIFTEYWGPKKELTTEQLMARRVMFKINVVNLHTNDIENIPEGSRERGGWTTKSSFKALTRRLLHAMMTNDDFTVVLAGHSNAAGHGNHFLQSYIMQFHKIMEPIFKRLGMNLITRNNAHSGYGTVQDALGSGSIYGDKVDMIVWDSSSSEGETGFDLFCRQALIGGKRPPVLWATGSEFSVLKNLHINADADIMEFGTGMEGVLMTESSEQVETLPWATRYLKCPENYRDLCDEDKHRFRTTCWVDRDDVVPQTRQKKYAPRQRIDHPGFRVHQLTGRVLAFTLLNALQDAIDTWSEETIFAGYPLSDEHWHITDHFENIQNKARNLDPSVGKCNSMEGLPDRACTTPLQGRTESTPRANPEETSITSIIKPTPDGYVPKLEKQMLYDGPDVANPSLMIPGSELDVHTIVSNRRELNGMKISAESNSRLIQQNKTDEIMPGRGWEVTGSLPGNCDGTATGICGRLSDSSCLLYGHMDMEGGLLGNALSGWLVMNLSNITEGLIILKLDTSHDAGESTKTKDLTDGDNGGYDDMIFDYAINGRVTSLTKDEFEKMVTKPQRKVELLTILDNPDMTEGGDAQVIEVAIQLRNCGRQCTFSLTHVYWA